MGMDIDILEKLISSYMYNDGGKRGVTEQKPFRFLVYIVTICHNPTGRCMAPGNDIVLFLQVPLSLLFS